MEVHVNSDCAGNAKLRSCVALVLGIAILLSACASPPTERRIHLPLLQGWFEGQTVFYITTEVSDAQMAQAKKLPTPHAWH